MNPAPKERDLSESEEEQQQPPKQDAAVDTSLIEALPQPESSSSDSSSESEDETKYKQKSIRPASSKHTHSSQLHRRR